MTANHLHPRAILEQKAEAWGLSLGDVQFATKMDESDPLKHLREEFCYPLKKGLPNVDPELINEDDECVYLCGNSLGLLPRGLKPLMEKILDEWGQLGVHGHRHGTLPWAYCDEYVNEDAAKLVGALRHEVAIMNGLTVNIHLLLISFYKPIPKRHKVLLEKHAFPSDHYAIESQIKLRGYDPDTSMIFLEPRVGEELLRMEDILSVLEEQGEDIAVVLLPGVQYYTGQLFDMGAITKAAQTKGCFVGWDLAHAVGNVEIFLHDWNVDFAAWCSYKYVNSGAGAIAGAYIHERHKLSNFPKLTGWWGHKMSSRFVMDNKFDGGDGIEAHRLSNPPILLCTALRASLDVFNKTSMSALRTKSQLLTGYLEWLLQHHLSESTNSDVYVRIITSSDPEQRGCQLSLMFSVSITHVYDELTKRGVALDKREPNVLRVAPTPSYNSFMDVYKFVRLLCQALNTSI